MNKESHQQKKSNDEKIRELEAQLEGKNSYFYNYMNDDKKKKKDDEDECAKNEFAYDTLKEKEKKREEEDGMYWQKLQRDSLWGKQLKNREELKKTQAAPVTQNQELGWREPLDTFNFGNSRSGMVKRTFYDHGHLS